MQKIWQWVRDRKTHTIRKWRSTLVRTPRDDENVNGLAGKRHVESLSALQSVPSQEYEEFFEETEPQIQLALGNERGDSSRSPQSPRSSSFRRACPVLPLDVDPDGGWAPQKSPTPRRSPRQIRFAIPEVQITIDEDDSANVCCSPSPSGSQTPPLEIEWTPVASTRPGARLSADYQPMEGPVHRPSVPNLPTVSFDRSASPPRRRSFGEKMHRSADRSPVNKHSPTRKLSLAAVQQRRQSQVQMVASMSGRRTSTTLMPLTCAQIHLIRSLWRQVYITKGPTVIGTSIYHRLCFKNPLVKEQLRRVPLPPQFNNHDGFIKAHCKAIGELVDQIVENLDNLDATTDELIRIGKVHARVLKGELTGKLWNTVAETFIDCTLEWGDKRCRSETVRKAWALIIAFMIEKIKIGHHEQRKLMLSTRQSVPHINVPLDRLRIAH